MIFLGWDFPLSLFVKIDWGEKCGGPIGAHELVKYPSLCTTPNSLRIEVQLGLGVQIKSTRRSTYHASVSIIFRPSILI